MDIKNILKTIFMIVVASAVEIALFSIIMTFLILLPGLSNLLASNKAFIEIISLIIGLAFGIISIKVLFKLNKQFLILIVVVMILLLPLMYYTLQVSLEEYVQFYTELLRDDEYLKSVYKDDYILLLPSYYESWKENVVNLAESVIPEIRNIASKVNIIFITSNGIGLIIGGLITKRKKNEELSS